MSTFPVHLPVRHAPVIRPARLPALNQRIEVWFLTTLLLTSVGIVCLNIDWATGIWEMLLFAFAVVVAFRFDHAVEMGILPPLAAACAIPLFGVAQILLHASAYSYVTLQASIQWAVLPAGILLGAALFRSHPKRDVFLHSLWVVAAIVTALELYQLFVLGRYNVTPTGLPLMSSNFYAELAELLLPVVLATALRAGGAFWLGCALSVVMAGTTVAAGARMGSVLVLLEIAAVIWRTRSTPGYIKLTWRRHAAPLLGMLLFAVVLEGSSNLMQRLHEPHPFTDRPEVAASAFQMFTAHPIAGFGLGSFATVYPKYSHFETAYYVNHAHNDYLELADAGGVIALGLWLLLVALVAPALARTPWALGIFAILIHGISDFPLYRLPILALLGVLMGVAKERDLRKSAAETELEPNRRA